MSARNTKNKEKPPVLEGTIEESLPTSPKVETPQPESEPDIIEDAEYKVLPDLQVGDTLWREYDDGSVHAATIESVDDDGMSAHIRFDGDTDDAYEGFQGMIRLNTDGSISHGWRLGTPPEQPAETDAQFAFLQSLAYKMRDEELRFKGPGGEIVAPTGEVDAGKFVVETEEGGEMKIPSTDFIRDYMPIDENEPTSGEKENAWNPVSRRNLQNAIDAYNKGVSSDQQIKLEELEKEALANLLESSPANEKIETMEQLAPDEAHQLQDYLEKLRLAATKKLGGEDNPEVREYFENDLDAKRSRLAELTYKRINSPAVANWLRLPKNRKELEAVQDEYDESLRALGRWELTGAADDEERQTKATEIALQEMFALRTEIDQQLHTQVEEAVEERSGLQKARDWVNRVSQKEILKLKIKGKERHLRIGHLATAGAGFGIGVGVRLAMSATGAVAAGTAAGLVAGGVIGGIRAHKNIKSGLLDSSTEAEKVALKEGIGKGGNLDEILRDRLSGETSRAKKERLKKVVGRMGRAAAIGAGAGFGGSLLGVGVVAAGDWLAGATPDYHGGLLGDLNIPDVEASAAEGNGAEVTDQPSSDTPEIEPTPEPLTAQELLQQYAGENADTAAVVEAGEGPYSLFESMGIPQDQYAELFNNQELMEKLVENGDAYSLQEAGVQDNGFGLSHTGPISPDSVQAIYEAANMTSPDALSMADSGLPPTYAELPADLQSMAENNPVLTDIPNGMGGEELMNQLGVSPDAWGDIQSDLREAAPRDFYDMGNGNVGISHPGPLSPDGVKALVDQLNQHGYRIR